MATRDFSKWRLSFAAGLCLLTGLRASAEDYAVGWYWLATSDTSKNSSSFTRANWLYENSGDPVAVSSGSKCYVPEGLTLFAGSGYSSFNVNLALDGRLLEGQLHVGEDPEQDFPPVLLVKDDEVGGEIERVDVLMQKLGAEGMEGADAPQMEVHPVAFATYILSPKS